MTLVATRLKASASISKNTKYVSYWDKRNNFTGSHLVKSPVLLSSNGSRRAYVAVEAIAFQPKDLSKYVGPLCENASRLFFAENGQSKYALDFPQSQEDFSDGNSSALVDWSSDECGSC
jgi:hypothetical protein